MSEARSLVVVVVGSIVLSMASRRASGQDVDCDSFPFNVVVHADPIVPRPHQSPEVRPWSDEVALPRGGRTTFYVSIVSQLEDVGPLSGIQGFSLGFNVTGNVTIDAAEFDGTSSANVPDGLTQGGTLSYVMLADPIVTSPEEEPQGQAVVLAHIYSLMFPVTMIPTGTANVVAVEVSAPEDEDPAGAIVFRDGTSGRMAVSNALTVRGETRRPGPADQPLACARGAAIVAVKESTFVRGDADGNGAIELTDGIYIHRYLFSGIPAALACEDAADLNDSGDLDITDGILVFLYLFIGGRAPASPFPNCGVDRSGGDGLTCESFDRCQS